MSGRVFLGPGRHLVGLELYKDEVRVHCATCRNWVPKTADEDYSSGFIAELRDMTYQVPDGFDGICANAESTAGRPVQSESGSVAVDFERYSAVLVTRSDFYCPGWEPRA